ncbi:WYL domain-containing protein [Lancefieldella parvula]|uniref:helix-turn-helix transcriptional regulator n=1 Tax=Lancefieldella parvula TaxID=1382 RepID=UPI0028D23C0E|nr:WYL domain-containing protein [Lancefieldella parvula]
MAVKNTSFGRKNISSAVYKLILLASTLRESFDAVELSAVRSRFGIFSEEAAILMELLQLTDENGYLPLPLTGDQDTLTLVGESPFTARRLVLTDEETLALKEAFTALALPQESVFWSLLKPPYTKNSSPDGSSVSLVSKSHSKEVDTFLACSNAIAESQVISFDYRSEASVAEARGDRDAAISQREVLPYKLSYGENGWLIEGVDLNLEQQRVFRVNRMSCIETQSASFEHRKLAERVQDSAMQEKSQLVELTFFDKNALTHYSWPGLKTVGSQCNAAEIKATIPYYGGTWLLQRLLALKGKVTTKDKAVMHAMRTYAASLLAAEEQL